MNFFLTNVWLEDNLQQFNLISIGFGLIMQSVRTCRFNIMNSQDVWEFRLSLVTCTSKLVIEHKHLMII